MGRLLLLVLILATYIVKGKPWNLAIEVDFDNGTNIQVWQCNNSTGQKWKFMKDDSTIRLIADNKCIDIANFGTEDGSNIWLFACHTKVKSPNRQNQEWTYNSNGTITSVMSGKCVEAATAEVGANIQLNHCSGGDNQRWMYDEATGEIKGQKFGLCIDVGSFASCQEKPWSGYPYCNTKLDPLTRAQDVAGRLNVPEMIEVMLAGGKGVPRLGVPPFSHNECIHGAHNNGKNLTTNFPQVISYARSFDRELIYSIARAISDEVRGNHNDAIRSGKYSGRFGLVCWSPVVNVCRDPRWGRCQEGYGEDPYLNGELATQFITALQNMNSSKYVQAGATCKHFDVHTGPENIPESRHKFDAVVSYRDWIETFQPAFKACTTAGAMSYMCAYSAINGVPACANRELLTELLRETWKFDGFVVSDCGAVSNVYRTHNFSRSDAEAAEFCVKAGCDWNCGHEYQYLTNSTQQGRLSKEELSVSVVRIMKTFIMLGELDPPDMVPYSKLTLATVVDAHVKVNNQAAKESIVLMENPKGILPLDLSKYKSVAIVGPCADNPTCYEGDYAATAKYTITVKAAFDNKTKLKVNYSPGCKDVWCTDNSGFAEAIKSASSSDIILYVGGISRTVEGEGHDRINITLPGLQPDLILGLKKTSKPVVVVLTHGAPIPSPVYSEVDAVISAGYTGQESGNAVLSVLTGEFNPAGKLVVTWYTGNEQLPPMVSYSMVNRTYRYMVDKPQYYFGYGLSYTTFNYSDLMIQPTTIPPCEVVQVEVKVTNTGQVTGSEVVQFYMSFKNATVPVPNIKLVNFERESDMTAGETRTVKVEVSASQMTVVRESDFAEVIEPGQYVVYAGGSQPGDDKAPANVLMGSFEVSGDETPLSQCTTL